MDEAYCRRGPLVAARPLDGRVFVGVSAKLRYAKFTAAAAPSHSLGRGKNEA